MKRLILLGKTNWFPSMSELEVEDFGPSSIDSRRDSDLEAKLNATNATATHTEKTLPKPEGDDEGMHKAMKRAPKTFEVPLLYFLYFCCFFSILFE